MINKKIVYEALNRSLASESSHNSPRKNQTSTQDSLISLLIFDIFGGEILKTHSKKDWHFYNRIDGERVDFALTNDPSVTDQNKEFEDIPSSPDEPLGYVDQTDYSTFFMKFVKAFEETIGLDKYNRGYSI
jgi:hypothetical protein